MVNAYLISRPLVARSYTCSDPVQSSLIAMTPIHVIKNKNYFSVDRTEYAASINFE